VLLCRQLKNRAAQGRLKPGGRGRHARATTPKKNKSFLYQTEATTRKEKWQLALSQSRKRKQPKLKWHTMVLGTDPATRPNESLSVKNSTKLIQIQHKHKKEK
jgi:hypothetical protein